MRESNFSFPSQNKACVCISSQLYDRRALDSTSPLPLFNSLTHLTYLTSTSPRIREIMTMDGGLERLVRILRDFCISPPPPENPALLYGLLPPTSRPPKPAPTLNPQSFDKQAAYRFSLAFQCVVNIGVRGSEPIRSRVVQAGTLEVVGCILEAWLSSKGFAVGPSSSATGLPRETREQRMARKEAQQQQRQREQAAQLARELSRQIALEQRAQRDHARPPLYVMSAPGRAEDSGPHHTSGSSSQLLLISSTPAASSSNSDTEMSTDVSTAVTPVESNAITGTVLVPSRDRSGTIIARPIWDATPNEPATTTATATATLARQRTQRPLPTAPLHDQPSPSTSTDNSRPETETEDDGDVDGDGDVSMDSEDRHVGGPGVAAASASPSPEPHPSPHRHISVPRTAVGIVSDEPPQGGVGNMNMNMGVGIGAISADAHIIINEAGAGADGGVSVGVGVGVEDGIVSLEPNDDFAMGAPPGAPGAIANEGTTPRGLALEPGAPTLPASQTTTTTMRRRAAGEAPPDVTPRAGVVNLPAAGPARVTAGGGGAGTSAQHLLPHHHQRNATIRGRPATNAAADAATGIATTTIGPGGAGPAGAAGRGAANAAAPATAGSVMHVARESGGSGGGGDAGPYRDEDVLLSLQLLAYLSKYPHVRQAFYQPRATFHPASANLPMHSRYLPSAAPATPVGGKEKEKEKTSLVQQPAELKENQNQNQTQTHGFFRAFASAAVARGKEKEKAVAGPSSLSGVVFSGASASASTSASASAAGGPSAPAPAPASAPPQRQTNVFSLVERFTFKPSSSETDLPNPPPRLPPEIQYWAGVIMRNACRKDESRGGIRQCANMLCGRWESYPREFAKCRRCRKAKYCGKECQSTAWSEGHRFWCSAKDADEEGGEHHGPSSHGHRGQQQQQQHQHQQPLQRGGTISVAPDTSGSAPIALASATSSATVVVPRSERRERVPLDAPSSSSSSSLSLSLSNAGDPGASGSASGSASSPSTAQAYAQAHRTSYAFVPPLLPPPPPSSSASPNAASVARHGQYGPRLMNVNLPAAGQADEDRALPAAATTPAGRLALSFPRRRAETVTGQMTMSVAAATSGAVYAEDQDMVLG